MFLFIENVDFPHWVTDIIEHSEADYCLLVQWATVYSVQILIRRDHRVDNHRTLIMARVHPQQTFCNVPSPLEGSTLMLSTESSTC